MDSTPDVTHADQLTFIIRYVEDDSSIVERFLKFIQLDGNGQHDAKSILTTFYELLRNTTLI